MICIQPSPAGHGGHWRNESRGWLMAALWTISLPWPGRGWMTVGGVPHRSRANTGKRGRGYLRPETRRRREPSDFDEWNVFISRRFFTALLRRTMITFLYFRVPNGGRKNEILTVEETPLADETRTSDRCPHNDRHKNKTIRPRTRQGKNERRRSEWDNEKSAISFARFYRIRVYCKCKTFENSKTVAHIARRRTSWSQICILCPNVGFLSEKNTWFIRIGYTEYTLM